MSRPKTFAVTHLDRESAAPPQRSTCSGFCTRTSGKRCCAETAGARNVRPVTTIKTNISPSAQIDRIVLGLGLAYWASGGGELGYGSGWGEANESSYKPNPVWSDLRRSTPIGSWTARRASCRPNPVWSDLRRSTPIGNWTASPEHKRWLPETAQSWLSRVSIRGVARLELPSLC